MDDNNIDDDVDEADEINGRGDMQVLKSLQKELAETREEAQTNLSGWQRSQADFENYKKRKENESKELIEFAREVTVAKLLPTLDSLEQAIRHMPHKQAEDGVELSPEEFQKKYEQWASGAEGLVNQLDKVLAELGVKKIEAVGKRFDPNFHEAIQEVPGDEDGIVMQEFVTGYELNGKVIRPSQVSISKASHE